MFKVQIVQVIEENGKERCRFVKSTPLFSALDAARYFNRLLNMERGDFLDLVESFGVGHVPGARYMITKFNDDVELDTKWR